MIRFLSIMVISLLGLVPSTSLIFGEESKDLSQVFSLPPQKEVKQKVISGIFLSTLGRFDPIKRIINASFYAWWRTTDPTYHPDKTVEVVNTPDFKKHWVQKGKVGSEYLTLARFFADISVLPDIRHFPFDRQKIIISLEDVLYDMNSVEFVPDIKNSGISKDLKLGGWIVKGFDITQTPYTYESNFGNSNYEHNTSSRLSMILEIKRLGFRIFFNSFTGFLLAAFLCMITFCVDTSNLVARSNIALGAIFLTIGNKYIIDQTLPIVPVFTLIDAIQTSTFLIITAAVSTNVLCYGLSLKGSKKLSFFLNRFVGIFLSLGYITYLSYKIYLAINS